MADQVSITEIDKEAKKLKRNLEGWREVILPLNSILLWEKNSYCGLIVGVTTISFLLFWHIDPSILTTFSVTGLFLTIIDYLVPTITVHVCHPENWTSAKERKLESICKTLATNKLHLANSLKSFYHMRQDSPKLYYLIVIATLLLLSWIGNVINNLFLTYLFVTILLLWPGLQHRGILSDYIAKLNTIMPFMQNKAAMKSE